MNAVTVIGVIMLGTQLVAFLLQKCVANLFKIHFNVEEILGVVVENAKDRRLADANFELLHDHADEPLLLPG